MKVTNELSSLRLFQRIRVVYFSACIVICMIANSSFAFRFARSTSGVRPSSLCRTGAFRRSSASVPFQRRMLAAAAKGGGSNWNKIPLASMFGGLASTVVGKSTDDMSKKGTTLAVDAALAELLASGTLLSWSDIRIKLESLQTTEEEKKFRKNLEKGFGVASPLHKVRLFDESNKKEDIRVVFYRDSASWCPYCQKVWLALEEKRIPYRIEKVNMRCYGDKPASFMKLQPSGNIPVAVIDGRVYGQSNDIMYALEEKFPQHKSLIDVPRSLFDTKGLELLRLERQIFSVWMYWLTGSGDYKDTFTGTLNDVEAALNQQGGPFFLGKSVSLVDFMYAPFLERMAASLLYYKGFMMRTPPGTKSDFPALNKWFDAMETLSSYQLVKSDYYTHCWDLPPQLGGCVPDPAGEPFRKAIDGERSVLDSTRSSWELPLEPHLGGIEPDWEWAAADAAMAQREAVERVSANHEAIVRFAARGAGKKGFPPVSAPLADPNATPSEAVQNAVDGMMRVLCMALLEAEKQDGSLIDVTQKIVTAAGNDRPFIDGVVASLEYLKDRVGVPRDMKLPAARQLRGHLNWAIAELQKGAN